MIQYLKRKFSPPKTAVRRFNAAQSSRLTLDWITACLSQDGEMKGQLPILRDRSRDLERNNEWVKGFLRSLEQHAWRKGRVFTGKS